MVEWSVSCVNDGPLAVFSARRGGVGLPPADQLRATTFRVVDELLTSLGCGDPVGWHRRDLTAALLWASHDVAAWEGEEWAVEEDESGHAAHWGGPDRTQFSWLRARGIPVDAVVGIYQDYDGFGLDFVSHAAAELSPTAEGIVRPRRNLSLPTGPINGIEVVLDTSLQSDYGPGVWSEALIHTTEGTVLLVAAEAYSSQEWHLYDESVVVLPSLATADRLEWVPARRPWTSTVGMKR